MTLAHNLIPSRVDELARNLSMAEFAAREDCRAVLLVSVSAEGAELLDGLAQTYGPQNANDAAVQVLDFHTVVATQDATERMLAGAPAHADVSLRDLRRWVERGPCFAVPIAKRDATFSERISIGRAINKDISLRNGSVSKLHGWFEWSPEGELLVADAGSKNGTTLDGVALEPRAPMAVRYGTALRIGRITTTVCPGELYWHLVEAL